MPELPEVETIVRGLRPKLLHQTVRHVTVYKPLVVREPAKAFASALKGRAVTDIKRHGKSMFLVFDDKTILKVHLGMTGQLLFQPKKTPPDPYVRVYFELSSKDVDLVYRDVRQFGRLKFVSEPFEKSWGPDAWDSPAAALAIALRKKTGMVKHALLNQLVLAGVGNIYADESLNMSHIHPKTRLEKLSDAEIDRLAVAVRAVLKRSLGSGGTSFRNYTNTDGVQGEFKGQLRVYGREGKNCPECGTKIVKTVVASRGTHFCPSCQKVSRRR